MVPDNRLTLLMTRAMSESVTVSERVWRPAGAAASAACTVGSSERQGTIRPDERESDRQHGCAICSRIQQHG
jgi:hypothetical protein